VGEPLLRRERLDLRRKSSTFFFSRAAFVAAPLLTVGIEIPQKQNRRRKLTNKILELSDIACSRGGKIYGTYGYSFIRCSPKFNGLQASIDVQLLVRGCVFDKYTHTTMH